MIRVVLLSIAISTAVHAQSFISELKAEPNPVRRAQKALTLADDAFESAHQYYSSGNVQKGDELLDNMTAALRECVQSLGSAHKPVMYKRAELNVATLQRRMQGLLDDIDAQQRGWAEYTNRKLEEIHEALLDGVMRK